jgi:nucleoside-diphosphate-sugar epimerase
LVHAASYVGPASILAYQGALGAEIIDSSRDVVRCCVKDKLPLVYVSSAEVYGTSGILVENADVRVPPYYNARIEYALAKLTCEAMVLNNAVNHLRSMVIRPFNVAGPLQSRAGGFVMPTFVQQALGGHPITVFDTGRQTRAFLASSDLAAFLAGFVDEKTLSEPRVFNVGNPDNAITMLALAHRVRELVGSDSEIVMTSGVEVYGPRYREAESIEKVPDISRATSLGWRPERSLDDIILETVDFYRSSADTRGADARLDGVPRADANVASIGLDA